ncbi:unnamed protein product [Ixodes persulcatus]
MSKFYILFYFVVRCADITNLKIDTKFYRHRKKKIHLRRFV